MSLLVMKKFITAIVAVICLATSTGATLRFHYCMGELVGWGFGNKEAKHCAGCGMTKEETDSKGCCKDEDKFIKNTSDQKSTETTYPTLNLFTVIQPSVLFDVNCLLRTAVSKKKPFSNAPLRRCGTPVYIINCVFLI